MNTPKFARWPSDNHYSALLTFRCFRKTLGARQAYWLALFRYGWPGSSEYAYTHLNTQSRLAAMVP